MSNVKVHKLEVMIMDFDGLGADGVKQELESQRFANDCIHPKVKRIESREVDWHDEHPLNKLATCEEEYKRLFSTPPLPPHLLKPMTASECKEKFVEMLGDTIPEKSEPKNTILEAAKRLKQQAVEREAQQQVTIDDFLSTVREEVMALQAISACVVTPGKKGFVISRCGGALEITVSVNPHNVEVAEFEIRRTPRGAPRTGDNLVEVGVGTNQFRYLLAQMVAKHIL